MNDSITRDTEFAALPSAGLSRRLAALVYDGLLLTAISFGYTAGVLLLRVEWLGAHEGRPLGGLELVGLWLCLSLFQSWCWRRSGQTLGMKTWRLRLQARDGSPPSWAQCWLRCLLGPPAILLFGIGYLWRFVSASGDCLHDLGSGTRVVLLPKAVDKKAVDKIKRNIASR